MSLELLQVAEAVAREKDINKNEVVGAMEQAIQMAAKRKFGLHLNISATIDRLSGDVNIKRIRTVAETVMEPLSMDEVRLAMRENRAPALQTAVDKNGKKLEENDVFLTLKAAQKIKPDAALGDELIEDLPQFDFGRVAAQAAKQVIFQKVRDAERGRQFSEYENQAGQIVSGIVKKVDRFGVLVDLGRAEALLPHDEMIPRETYRPNDRLRAYIFKVSRELRGAQVLLSRTHPQFLVKLFEEEVPEIASGLIEIINAARDPGMRAKIAVKSNDQNMDPVGACVGIRGSRVKAITAELQGERIDIIEWSADPAMFLVRALQPAEVSKVVLDETSNRIEVVVSEDKLSLAIGRRGQNVRLASMLTGWDIDIMSEQEEADKRAKEYEAISGQFIQRLDVDDTLARLLIAEGFSTVDELLMVPAEELANIEGLDLAVAEELQRRAQASVDAFAKETKKLGVEEALKTLEGMNSSLLMELAQKDIKSRDDLGELATDELLEILPEGLLSEKAAEKLIMAARAHWFADEEEAEVDPAAVKKPKAAAGNEAAKSA